MDEFHGYGTRLLCQLNGQKINWKGGTWSDSPCPVCSNIPGFEKGPGEGSYASTMRHFRRILGPLQGRLSRVRCFVLFQEPRVQKKFFRTAPPLSDPKLLDDKTHRYFLLSTAAWRNLKLHELIGCNEPCWPTQETSHHYLRRYFKRGAEGTWSYDGFIAYFIFLLQMNDVYITNLAKCSFNRKSAKAYELCGQTHLQQEMDSFMPNVVLTFGDPSIFNKEIGEWCDRPESGVKVMLPLWHPAARKSHQEKRRTLIEGVRAAESEFRLLECDVERIVGLWTQDLDKVLAS